MSRLVELEADGPRRLEESDIDDEKGDIAICQCGLSAAFPFCDGSHRQTEDEADGQRYVYSEDGTRERVERIVRADEPTDSDLEESTDSDLEKSTDSDLEESI